jgi:GT2 family glycosyltransferase
MNQHAHQVSIVVLHFNTLQLTHNCLQSIYDYQGDLDFEIFLVDNASTDGSGLQLVEEFPDVQFQRLDQPLGFSAANNIALRQAKGRYLLLLNSDTAFYNDALEQALSYMEQHTQVGITGVHLHKLDGTFDVACHRSLPTPATAFFKMIGLSRLFPNSSLLARYNLTYLSPEDTFPVDAISGAFMMIRSEALEEVGLLDEDFEFYGEDIDLCYRFRQAGWTVMYNGSIKVIHIKGGSTDHSDPWTINNFHNSMLIFYRKHFAHLYSSPLNLSVRFGVNLRKWIFLRRAAYLRRKWHREDTTQHP